MVMALEEREQSLSELGTGAGSAGDGTGRDTDLKRHRKPEGTE